MEVNWELRIKIIEEYGTQSDFAEAVGSDETFVSKVVRGRRKLSDEKKREWAEKLNCMLGDIFTGDENEAVVTM